MKYFIICCFIFAFCHLTVAQNFDHKPKLSLSTQKYLKELRKPVLENQSEERFIYKKQADGNLLLSALIKVKSPLIVEENLKIISAKIGTKAGNIWTVQVPVEQINTFTEISGIEYIQLDEPVFPNMKEARESTRVDSVHKGYNLPLPYSGKDVIIGVIDFGFDYNHPTFFDTLGSHYRIKRVWELGTSGTSPAGYTYGHELKDTNDIKTQGTDNPVQTHGTAVAGIAAGSGYGSTNNQLRGIAYESDLVFVGVRRDENEGQWKQSSWTDFIDGVNYIFNYAESVGKPAVINISWGGQSGPHDGTTLFNQACDNLTGPGKIIVMSAGNRGKRKIHLDKTFTANDTLISTFVTFSKEHHKRTWVDIWGDEGETFCVKATLYNKEVEGNTTEFVCIDDQIHHFSLIGANGVDTCHIEFLTASSEFNNKPRIIADIFNKASDSVAISVYGSSGNINLWNEYFYYGFTHGYRSTFSDYGFPWASDGNTDMTVNDMASASSVLMVGAYTSKKNWTDINGSTWAYTQETTGKIASFSSRGPLANGTVKPDITAPGLTLATAISSYDTAYTPTGSDKIFVAEEYQDPSTTKKYYYAEFTGTSASSPAAAGIVALMLQANPYMRPETVKSIISETAIHDSHTGPISAPGSNTWGQGKINAYDAIQASILQVGAYNYTGKKLDFTVFPNPNNGQFLLNYNSEQAENLLIEVLNMSGSTILQETWTTSMGWNTHEVNLSNFSKGIYLVHLTSYNGSANARLVIQ